MVCQRDGAFGSSGERWVSTFAPPRLELPGFAETHGEAPESRQARTHAVRPRRLHHPPRDVRRHVGEAIGEVAVKLSVAR